MADYLFDLGAGLDRKDAGQAAASGVTPEDERRREFYLFLVEVIHDLAEWRPFLHSDDVHSDLRSRKVAWPKGVSRNVLGSAWTQCARKGYIEKSGRYEASHRAARHANETPVWRSKILKRKDIP